MGSVPMSSEPRLLLDVLPARALRRVARMLLTTRRALLSFASVSPRCRDAALAAANGSFRVRARASCAGDLRLDEDLFDELWPTLTALAVDDVPPAWGERSVRGAHPLHAPCVRTLQLVASPHLLAALPRGVRDLRLHLPHSLARQQFFGALSELTLFSLHVHLEPPPPRAQPPSLLRYPQLGVCLEPAGRGELLAASCPLLQVLRFFFVLAPPFQPAPALFPNLRAFSAPGAVHAPPASVRRLALSDCSPRAAAELRDALAELSLRQHALRYDQVFALLACCGLRALTLRLHAGAEAGLLAAPFLWRLRRLELEWVPLPARGADASLDALDEHDEQARLDEDQPRFWSPPDGLLAALLEDTSRLQELRLRAVSCERAELRRVLRHVGRGLRRFAVDVCGQPEPSVSRLVALLHLLSTYCHNLQRFEPADAERVGVRVVVAHALQLDAGFSIERLHRAFERAARRLPFLTLPPELRDARFLSGHSELMTREAWCELGFDADAEDLF